MEKNKELEELKEALVKCEKEREEHLNGWKRAKADFINYKKEEAQRFEEVLKFSKEALLRELIGVLDSFDLASANQTGSDSQTKGIQIIMGQLEDVLKKFGLERIEFSVGQVFNPALHEAITEVDSEKPVGIIVEELSRGYVLGGKVIRPTRVKLSKGESK